MKSHSASHWDASKKQITTGFLEISFCSLLGLLNCFRPLGFLIAMWTKPPFSPLHFPVCCCQDDQTNALPLASFYQPPAVKIHGWMEMGDHHTEPRTHSLTPFIQSLPPLFSTKTSVLLSTLAAYPPLAAYYPYAACPWGCCCDQSADGGIRTLPGFE